MDMGRLVAGIALTAAIVASLAAFRPPPFMGTDEDLLVRDACACASRPMNVTKAYLLRGVVVRDGEVVAGRLVPPFCSEVEVRGGCVAYRLPLKAEAGRLEGWVLLNLFSSGNGTCVVRRVVLQEEAP